MNDRPPMGDFAAWQTYWREEGKANRDKCDRMAEVIRAMKTCPDSDFAGLAYTLKTIDTDDTKDVVEAIRAGRDAGKYNNSQSSSTKGNRTWKQ